jgi:hypothetical protein
VPVSPKNCSGGAARCPKTLLVFVVVLMWCGCFDPLVFSPNAAKASNTSFEPSWMTLAGQRPISVATAAPTHVPVRYCSRSRSPGSRWNVTFPFPETLQASMFIAPVPCVCTFATTVPINGLRKSHQSSQAGFNAVPHPCHSLAASVAGAVATDAARAVVTPITSRSAPAALSRALLKSSDFGNPLPNRCATRSLTS